MTTIELERDDAALLDVCVDRLLAGQDWRVVVADECKAAPLASHMAVAEIVLTVARQSNAPDEQTRTRTWRRVVRRIGAAVRRSATVRWPAPAVSIAVVAFVFGGANGTGFTL